MALYAVEQITLLLSGSSTRLLAIYILWAQYTPGDKSSRDFWGRSIGNLDAAGFLGMMGIRKGDMGLFAGE